MYLLVFLLVSGRAVARVMVVATAFNGRLLAHEVDGAGVMVVSLLAVSMVGIVVGCRVL